MNKPFHNGLFGLIGKMLCRHNGDPLPALESTRTLKVFHPSTTYYFSQLGRRVKGFILHDEVFTAYTGATTEGRSLRNKTLMQVALAGHDLTVTTNEKKAAGNPSIRRTASKRGRQRRRFGPPSSGSSLA
jgi:hypothetical protein